MSSFQKFLFSCGRVLFSLIFIFAGLNHVFNWDVNEELLVNTLLDNVSFTMAYGGVQIFLSHMVPWAAHLLLIATIFILLGGLLLFFGAQIRLAGLLLFLFLVPTTLLFHNFWFLEGGQRELETIMFLKNTGLMGGALVFMAIGKLAK